MGFEGLNRKPREIQEAVRTYNTEALRAMGRKGAERTNEIKAKKMDEGDAIDRLLSEHKKSDEQRLRESTNEHIITPDGEDLDHSKE